MPANRAGGTHARGTLASRTRLVEFAGRDAFSFRLPNVSAAAEQRGRAGERCLTNIEAFVNRIVVRHPRKFRMFDPDVRIACLPPRAWPTYDFTAKRVLFLLPSHALGDPRVSPAEGAIRGRASDGRALRSAAGAGR